MPIPKPRADEEESNFMGRCIGFLRSEGKPQDESVAICATQWDNRKDADMQQEFKRFQAPFEYEGKALDQDGTFTGYGSVFDVVDLDMDIVAQGAFKKSLGDWKKKKKLPPVVWQHDFRNPIGPYLEMTEDDKGLFVKGLLLVDEVQKAKEARALMKHGAVDGLSIGFITKDAKNGKDKEGRPVRVITKVDLLEVSIVTLAANTQARVTDIKAISIGAIENLTTPKEFEELLREAGFSRSAATAFVAKCRKQGEPASYDADAAAGLLASLRDATHQLKGAKQ